MVHGYHFVLFFKVWTDLQLGRQAELHCQMRFKVKWSKWTFLHLQMAPPPFGVPPVRLRLGGLLKAVDLKPGWFSILLRRFKAHAVGLHTGQLY